MAQTTPPSIRVTATHAPDKTPLRQASTALERQHDRHQSRIAAAASRLWEIALLAHLITETDIKAYVLPVSLFAVLSVASGEVTEPHGGGAAPSWSDMAAAPGPRAVIYLWLYVLYFDCSSQLDPASVEEDRLNKPWRPIPSGRLTMAGAGRWRAAATCLLPLASAVWLGGLPEALAFMAETWLYNRGGHSSWWGKNIINALFFSTGQLGAARVAAMALGRSVGVRTWAILGWCGLLCLTILATVQIQDLRDMAGDAARGRRTLPLALGDTPTRILSAIFVLVASVGLPAYWSRGGLTAAYVLPVALGALVGKRVLQHRHVKADRKTMHCYTMLWLPALYAVPLLSRYRLSSAV